MLGLVAAAKKEKTGEHGFRVAPPCGIPRVSGVSSATTAGAALRRRPCFVSSWCRSVDGERDHGRDASRATRRGNGCRGRQHRASHDDRGNEPPGHNRSARAPEARSCCRAATARRPSRSRCRARDRRAIAATVSCALSASIIWRSCPAVKPSARSRPSSRVRCSTLSDRLLTMPTAAMRALKPMSTENTAVGDGHHLVDPRVHLRVGRLRHADHVLPARHRDGEHRDERHADHETDRRARAALGVPHRVLGREPARGAAPEHPSDEPQRGRHHELRAEHEPGERQDAADDSDRARRAG